MAAITTGSGVQAPGGRRPASQPVGSVSSTGPAANDGRTAHVYVVRDSAATADRSRSSQLIRHLSNALSHCGPEIRFELHETWCAIRDPLNAGAAGPRDFRIAAALGPIESSRRDMVAIEALSVRGATVLRLRPGRAAAAFAGVLAPPVEALCSPLRPIGPRDDILIALAMTAHLLAQSTEPDVRKDPGALRVVQRLADMLPATRIDQDPIRGSEVRALAAWSQAWIGLALSDFAILERARRSLDQLTVEPGADFTRRETAQLHANLALVCLALGGTKEGSRRLSEGLGSARVSQSLISEDLEARMIDEVRGLVGDLAGALGLRHGDRRLLAEADRALRQACDRVNARARDADLAAMRARIENALAE